MTLYLLIAARNLVQAKRRSLLLSLALGLVTALLVFLLALSQGLTDSMIRSSTTLMSGHVNVGGFFKAKSTDANPIINRVAEIRAIVDEHAEGVDYVIDRQRGFARLVSESDSLQTVLVGVDVRQEERLLSQIQLATQADYKEGGGEQVAGDPRRLAEPNTALIFAAQAKRLGVDVGDVLTVTAQTMSGVNNTGEVRVVAIAKDVGFMSNWNVFVPKRTLQELYRLDEDTSGAVMIYLDDPAKAPQVMGTLREALEAEGFALRDYTPQPYFMKFELVAGEPWRGLRLDLTTWEDEISPLKWTLNAVETVSAILVTILLVIIVIGIMNTMWISVRERTREIGTLRAIGMGRAQVLAMFTAEAFLLGLMATTAGALVGALVSEGLDAARLRMPVDAMRAILMSDVLHLVVVPSRVIGAVVVFTLVCVLAALWPAAKAARMRPVTAIHHVG